MFAGIPIGVAYAQEPAITVAITTDRGSAPRLFARETAIGIISAVVAVFDIKLVSTQVTRKITRRSRIGFGLDPSRPTILSAIILPAPVTSSAFAREREPPKRRTTFKSMEFNASFYVRTPVSTKKSAPRQAES